MKERGRNPETPVDHFNEAVESFKNSLGENSDVSSFIPNLTGLRNLGFQKRVLEVLGIEEVLQSLIACTTSASEVALSNGAIAVSEEVRQSKENLQNLFDALGNKDDENTKPAERKLDDKKPAAPKPLDAQKMTDPKM